LYFQAKVNKDKSNMTYFESILSTSYRKGAKDNSL